MIYRALRGMIYCAAAQYDIISVPHIRRRRISSHEVRYHPEGISPVPPGTDIIAKGTCRSKCLLHGFSLRPGDSSPIPEARHSESVLMRQQVQRLQPPCSCNPCGSRSLPEKSASHTCRFVCFRQRKHDWRSAYEKRIILPAPQTQV